MAQKSKLRDIAEFALLFLALYILTQFALKKFFPEQFAPESIPVGVTISAVDKTLKSEHHPILILRNNTSEVLTLPETCPRPPVKIERQTDAGFLEITSEEIAVPCANVEPVDPSDDVNIDLAPWKYSLFSELGTYRASLNLPQTGSGTISAEFEIKQAGTITQMFRAFVSKPLLNLLIFIASIIPNHSLGFSIIILTLIVKLLLFIPTQHGLEGQKKMQLLQPRLEAIKKQYKDNPKKLQEETMRLWKEEKINPFQSCLPIFIQLPILIGLFYVIRDGSVLALSRHLIYAPYQDLSWSFDTQFFMLDLTSPSVYFFPPLLVVLQFLQMKLSFALAKRKKKDDAKPVNSQQLMQQRMMTYGLPFMIGFFAIKFPAAVSLYWGVSTVFAVLQQLWVNRRTG